MLLTWILCTTVQKISACFVRLSTYFFSLYLNFVVYKKSLGKFVKGVLKSPGKVLNFFVSKRVGTPYLGVGADVTWVTGLYLAISGSLPCVQHVTHMKEAVTEANDTTLLFVNELCLKQMIGNHCQFLLKPSGCLSVGKLVNKVLILTNLLDLSQLQLQFITSDKAC